MIYKDYIKWDRMPTNWCPGCSIGTVFRHLTLALEKAAVPREQMVVVSGIGCSGRAAGYFNVDSVHVTHGRAIPVAEGIKRSNEKLKVIVFSGDGDLVGIGGNHFLHSARRDSDIKVICINNGIYGMTGGQMAPTTLIGQKTTTTPGGRTAERAGYPIRVCEMLATLEGAAYVARVSVSNPKNVVQAKKAIRKAFETQIRGLGYSIVEILSQCPTNWHMTPAESAKWVDEKMAAYFPLGEFKSPKEG